MQMRFDGTLGFPGGIIDTGETPEQTVTREFAEEVGPREEFTEKDHLVTHYSEHSKFCLHFYAKEVAIGRFHEIERRAPTAVHWGEEVSNHGNMWSYQNASHFLSFQPSFQIPV